MCSEAKPDAHRFRDIILAAIDEQKVKKYKKFRPWSDKVAKQPRPKAALTPKTANSGAASGDKQLALQIRCGAMGDRCALNRPGTSVRCGMRIA